MTTIYFDLDGTLSDLFSVPNWRERLAARDSTPYRVARPLCPLESLRERLTRYHAAGYKLGIISWCSMGGDESFDEAVKTAKIDWLKEQRGECTAAGDENRLIRKRNKERSHQTELQREYDLEPEIEICR